MALFDMGQNQQVLPQLPNNLFSSLAPGTSPDAGGAGTLPVAPTEETDPNEEMIKQRMQAEWASNSGVHNFLDRLFNSPQSIQARRQQELLDQLIAYRMAMAKAEAPIEAARTREESALGVQKEKGKQALDLETMKGNILKEIQKMRETGATERANIGAGASKYRSDIIKKVGDQRAKEIQMRPGAEAARVAAKIGRGEPITEDDVDGYNLDVDYRTAPARENPLNQLLGGGTGTAPKEETPAVKKLKSRVPTKGGGAAKPEATSKKLDQLTASQFLKLSGGDKAKAREAAKAAGYTF